MLQLACLSVRLLLAVVQVNVLYCYGITFMVELSDVTKRSYAKDLLNNEMFKLVMAELERAALEQAINAPLADDRTRADQLAEVRAIRNITSRLRSYSTDAVATRQAPA